MRLLVAGGDRVDAGKTTFAAGLLAYVDGVGFKPRAGNDYWFDHDDYRRAIADGRLYGKDAARLAAAGKDAVAPEAINPVHRLWRPARGRDAGLVGAPHREFVLDRVGETYVVNARADVPDSARERLPLDEAITVDSVTALNEAIREHHLPALASLADRIRDYDRAVVESYGDVARPLDDLAIDAAAVVEPGRVCVYAGERYAAACEAVGASDERHGSLEERTDDVRARLDPAATVALPALPAAERDDPGAVADAYEVAYDALLATALP